LRWRIAILTSGAISYLDHQTVPGAVRAKNMAGSVAGLVWSGRAMGQIVFGKVIAYLPDHGFGYGAVFTVAGARYLSTFLIVLAVIPSIEPLNLEERSSYETAP
jgi:hypothetical protein